MVIHPAGGRGLCTLYRVCMCVCVCLMSIASHNNTLQSADNDRSVPETKRNISTFIKVYLYPLIIYLLCNMCSV